MPLETEWDPSYHHNCSVKRAQQLLGRHKMRLSTSRQRPNIDSILSPGWMAITLDLWGRGSPVMVPVPYNCVASKRYKLWQNTVHMRQGAAFSVEHGWALNTAGFLPLTGKGPWQFHSDDSLRSTIAPWPHYTRTLSSPPLVACSSHKRLLHRPREAPANVSPEIALFWARKWQFPSPK